MNTCAQKAQIARINRKLAKGWFKLCTSRSWGEKSNLGEYHIVNTWNNTVVASHVTPDQIEADLKARQFWWEDGWCSEVA